MYVDMRNGASNVWRQPVDGGPPQQITNFKSGRIFRFAWSRDGKTLICEREAVLNDLALITQPSDAGSLRDRNFYLSPSKSGLLVHYEIGSCIRPPQPD